MASTPEPRHSQPLAVALHPTTPLLAKASADGHLQIHDLRDQSVSASAHIDLTPDREHTLAIGGSAERPIVGWINSEGSPLLWAWTDPAGLAGNPSDLSGLRAFLPEIPTARYSRIWITAGPRPWLVLAGHPSGGFVSNGRISAHIDPPDRIIAAAASQGAGMLTLLTLGGDLILIKDPETRPSDTDAVGPCLLAVPERIAACPLSTLRPDRLSLPIGVTPAQLRRSDDPFVPTASLFWLNDAMINVVHAGQGHVRRWMMMDIRVGLTMAYEGVLPSWIDFGVQPQRGPNCELMWVSPQPNGATRFKPLQTKYKGEFVPIDRVGRVMSGHPAHMEALRAHGLRWDGQTIQLDRFQPDVFEVFDGALPSGQRTGPVEPTVLFEDAQQKIVGGQESADRLLLFRPASSETPKVLVHPALARVPDAVRWRVKGRPKVVLLGLDVEPAGEYLGLWRAPGGVELWSLRAADRLKAWGWKSKEDAVERRVVLAVDDPAYLPALHILEAMAEVEGRREVLVATVDFGDRGVRRVGALLVDADIGLDELVSKDIEGRLWHCRGEPMSL